MTDRLSKAGSRGSVWRRWEPHIHALGTVLADNYPEENGWELYLDALEAVSPPLEAIGVTDYCITRSYVRMREEKAGGRLCECELLFPNIELRLNIGTVRHQRFWFQRPRKLGEYLTHLVDSIMRRVCGVASA